MTKIQKLPETLIRLIAAGEVVERPAAVVKELLENSLDAGATEISIDLWGAGRTRIRITDNGEGMSREDAELALDRHATSKLRSLEDLHALHTFGFRGEALPSIAAVSRFTLATRTRETQDGWKLELEGGAVKSAAPFGMAPGTTIDVQDLFFNTPAREKFLKKDSTERTQLLKTIQESALAHPHVRYTVHIDGKEVLNLPAATHLGGRIADTWGISVAERLIELEIEQGPCRVRGFVNQVPAHHATKAFQSLFVNQRPVQQRQLTHAIYEAYHEWLPVGRHPVFVLFIDLDPTQVDVNVHPTKREVRFTNERALYDLLYTKIRGLFRDRFDTPMVRSGETLASGFFTARAKESIPASISTGPWEISSGSSVQESAAAVMTQAPLQSPLENTAHFRLEDLRYLGQFQRVYLLAEVGEELLLIDQHAASERVHYEQLLAIGTTATKARQAMLTPLVWETTAAQAETLRSYLSDLEALGFVLEPFGPTSFALKEWPASLPQIRQAKRFLDELVESFQSEQPTNQTQIQHEIAARAACRAAVMANDPLAPEEAHQLISALSSCVRPMTCPHGRPTLIRLSRQELDRRFRRT